MLALSRVGVLVERGAVESRETVRVLGEMAGDPVEDHADAGAVERVDEGAEVVGRAEAARRREEPRDLVAPRSVVGELQHRQQLDVREADALHMRDEACRQLLVRQELAVGVARPRPEMHLVDRHRLVERLAAQRPLRDPLAVLPDVFAFAADDRRRRRWSSPAAAHGSALRNGGPPAAGASSNL